MQFTIFNTYGPMSVWKGRLKDPVLIANQFTRNYILVQFFMAMLSLVSDGQCIAFLRCNSAEQQRSIADLVNTLVFCCLYPYYIFLSNQTHKN